MVRTVISLNLDDKRWLDSKAREQRVAMTEIVRRAIACYRETERRENGEDFERLLRQTAGLWRGEEGLEYQRRFRSEWGE